MQSVNGVIGGGQKGTEEEKQDMERPWTLWGQLVVVMAAPVDRDRYAPVGLPRLRASGHSSTRWVRSDTRPMDLDTVASQTPPRFSDQDPHSGPSQINRKAKLG